ncbi:hypothetical protein PENANT_c030G02399 [Penicillium antarcticum]|uniref:Uncharacterized protein n=1 Tax=Penicillium antarcticum TaxID=416450 RepID=A0A1V6PV87_9EURO|nr:hypothetical protein PENANT_c030G02399 [Penicillium antarcticum]
MQMESWRQRGYVPDSDSDSEDGFDSIEAKKANLDNDSDGPDLDYISTPISASTPNLKEGTNGSTQEHCERDGAEHGSITPSDVEDHACRESPEKRIRIQQATTSKANDERRTIHTELKGGAEGDANSHDEITPARRRGRKKYGTWSSATKTRNRRSSELRMTPAKNTENIYDLPESSQEQEKASSKPASQKSTPKASKYRWQSPPRVITEPRTSRANIRVEIPRFMSSSPDELSLIPLPTRKKTPVVNRVQPKEVLPPPAPPHLNSDDDSPLSSAPSSLGSDPAHNPMETEIVTNGDQNGDGQPQTATTSDLQDSLDDLLPHLDIPEDVLREMPQAEQRTFRKRNAIQLQPYYLEQLKYAQQMKARGVKPIRQAVPQQAQQTTDESQGQDSFDPNVPPSSPPQEEYLPPVRPEKPRNSVRQHQEHHDPETPRNREAHMVKRRKISHSSTPRARRDLMHKPSKPHGIRDTAPKNQRGTTAYELSSSPPHTGCLSSASKTPRASEGFRFPRGWTPPPRVTSPGAQEEEKSDEDEPAGPGSHSDEDIQSVSSNSQRCVSEKDQAEAEERAIRREQRRMRGVLPASWFRLDQKAKEDRAKPSQHDRHIGHRPDGKGVARKLIRRGYRSKPAATQQSTSLFDLGDSDDDEDERTNNSTTLITDGSSQRLTGTTRSEDPFALEAGDISEDNRIDYMFAPALRNSPGNRQKRKSLKRPKSKEGAANDERQRKRPKQTRMTDASNGGRRTKKSSTVARPRLGILDAPDVATQSRKEQPHFLRVAARNARSRQDGGRQSPTQKFLKLASRADTVDANESLRDWKRGAIRQTRISPPQPRARKRPQAPKKAPIPGPREDEAGPPSYFAEQTQASPETGAISVTSNQTPKPKSSSRRQPAQPEKRGHTWVIPRNTVVTSLKRNTPRPAVTSSAGPSGSKKLTATAFNQSLSQINRRYRNQHTCQGNRPSLTLDRYLTDSGSTSGGVNSLPRPPPAPLVEPKNQAPVQKAPPNRRRLKKHTPNRINLDNEEFRQTQDTAVFVSDDQEPPTVTQVGNAQPSSLSVGGLFNWHRFYPVDFGTPSLRDNTFFHESTFIGSGEFSNSLQVAKRDLDGGASSFSIQARDQTYHWTSWNDTVSSEMGSVFDVVIDNVERSATTSPEVGITAALGVASRLYRLLIKYTTENLVFIDPVDRTGFITRATGLVSVVRDPLVAFLSSDEYNKNGLVKIACFNVVFSNLIYQIASHQLVGPTLAVEAMDLVKTSATDVAGLIISDVGSSEFKRFLEENNKTERRESGLRDEYPSVEAYVVIKHLLRSSEQYKGCFEDLQLETFNSKVINDEKDVNRLEAGWRGLFTVLPFNEIDQLGIGRNGYQFTSAHDNWKLVKRLLSPALDHSEASSMTQPFSYNGYCRTLFHRCHRLINTWGWRECKPILDTLFDFFAKNTLYNLKLEEARGSPSFLDELDANPSLDARVGEPCFHTFLKIIASGLRFLTKRYDKKKIRNFAWRLLPNHGRVYPKEQPLRHEDLDALRNHHDLLSTLYWAVPDGCRPRLETIRNLVHPATSHREACSISLRSWSRLVRFKLSTDEEVSGLDPFGDWYGYFVTELQQQHSYARKEIEAQSTDDNRVSQQLIERTISQNQRQIETLLSTALAGLRAAVELAPQLEHAHRLVLKTPFDLILGLFNPKLPRVNVVVSEALQVLVVYTQKDVPAASVAETPTVVATDEDSQEFGDWTAFEDVWGEQTEQQTFPSEAVIHVERAFHPVVSQLVSNCFGEDHCPEDAILLSVVDCWTSIAQVLVRHRLRNWDNYLSEFGNDSWTRLRQTVQTRKFAPQFLAACIEKDSRIVSDCRVQVMGMWMTSLVERSSMLKFQHRLTEALLNENPKDPLLGNLPFSKDKKDRHTITLEEISSRRLSLLSSLSSNMREQLQNMELDGSRDFSATKQEYSEILQRVMTSMKDNYQELANGTAHTAQGAYVSFVHSVIGFLQQHTSDIKPIDPFFTDPASFPLPSNDPRYIVAKLKRYEPKLSSSSEIQTLTGFFQSISERAVIDGQQDYLVDQIHTSMKNTYEAGKSDKPTLRATFLQCIFPAYLEEALGNRAAWLLSRPIIQTITLVFNDLICNLDTLDPACVSSVVEMISVVFQSSTQALSSLENRRHRLASPATLAMLAVFMEMISSALPVVDYVNRTTGSGEEIFPFIEWFRNFTKAVTDYLHGTDSSAGSSPSDAFIAFPDAPGTIAGGRSDLFRTAHSLASTDLQIYLRKWSWHRGKYYFTRPGHESQEIGIETGDFALMDNQTEALTAFEDAASTFMHRAEVLELLF